MTRCLDEGKLQSYFDGELSIQLMESVTSHLASCVTCAAAARELEQESALLTAALSAEFEASIPSERLRQRIDAAVLGERVAVAKTSEKTGGLAVFFSALLSFGTQRTLGYASLMVMLAFAAIFGLAKMRSITPQVVQTTNQPGSDAIARVVEEVSPDDSKNQPTKPADDVKPVERQRNSGTPRPIRVSSAPVRKLAPVKLLPGERSYLQTIARLDSTIKSNKNAMRPSLQVEYERNLAVVDRAIAATRSAAKSNPNDADTADFMFAAYQSKVDLLNTIADARLSGGRGH